VHRGLSGPLKAVSAPSTGSVSSKASKPMKRARVESDHLTKTSPEPTPRHDLPMSFKKRGKLTDSRTASVDGTDVTSNSKKRKLEDNEVAQPPELAASRVMATSTKAHLLADSSLIAAVRARKAARGSARSGQKKLKIPTNDGE
jgi:hypothetical protein